MEVRDLLRRRAFGGLWLVASIAIAGCGEASSPTAAVPSATVATTPAASASATRPPLRSNATDSASPAVAVIDCGSIGPPEQLPQMNPQRYSLGNPDGLFKGCEMADILGALGPEGEKGGVMTTTAPDMLGRLTFLLIDGVCWDRLLHVTITLGTTPLPAHVRGHEKVPTGGQLEVPTLD